MNKETFEQAPVEKLNDRPDMAEVTLKKSGDEGIDVGLVDHYASLGFQYRETTPSGNVIMQMPRDQVMSLGQAAIDEHYRRVKGAERASVGPDVNLVEDKTERFTPKSASDFIGNLGLEEED